MDKIPEVLKLLFTLGNLKHAFRDHGKQEELLENSSTDYTICRAPMLSNTKNDTDVIATAEGANPATKFLSRNSTAAFFIMIIDNKEYLREMISVTNIPARK